MERRSLLSMIFGSDRNTTAPATSEFIALKNMYANSEYAFAELIITEEIYKNLTK